MLEIHCYWFLIDKDCISRKVVKTLWSACLIRALEQPMELAQFRMHCSISVMTIAGLGSMPSKMLLRAERRRESSEEPRVGRSKQMNTTEPAGFSGTTFDICRAVMLGSLQQYSSPAALRGITIGKQAMVRVRERLKHGHENVYTDHIRPYVVQGCK